MGTLRTARSIGAVRDVTSSRGLGSVASAGGVRGGTHARSTRSTAAFTLESCSLRGSTTELRGGRALSTEARDRWALGSGSRGASAVRGSTELWGSRAATSLCGGATGLTLGKRSSKRFARRRSIKRTTASCALLWATVRHASSIKSYTTNSALRSFAATIGNADVLAVRASSRTSRSGATASGSSGKTGALLLGAGDIRSLTLGYGTIRDVGAGGALRALTLSLWALRLVRSFVTNDGTVDAWAVAVDGRSRSAGSLRRGTGRELRARGT